MLRSNSRQAAENIRQYIIDGFDADGYTDQPPQTFPEIAKFIMEVFESESKGIRIPNQQERFISWCAGLPSVLDTCYYYNRSAVDDLAAILEETPEEAAKFTEQQAGYRLSYLMYREICKACK